MERVHRGEKDGSTPSDGFKLLVYCTRPIKPFVHYAKVENNTLMCYFMVRPCVTLRSLNTAKQLLACVGRGGRERRTEAPTQYMLCACSRSSRGLPQRDSPPVAAKQSVQTPCADKKP